MDYFLYYVANESFSNDGWQERQHTIFIFLVCHELLQKRVLYDMIFYTSIKAR